MSDTDTPTRRSLLGQSAAAIAVAATLPLSLPSPTPAQAKAQGVGRKAPQWDISEWINGDGGNVDKLKGRVIVIDFFQLWCPGCNKFSGPLLTFWQKRFSDDIAAGQLSLVKIHTVFEGHGYQTVKKLKSYVKEKGITLPVGVDRHIKGQRLPVTMKRYNTRGTPEMAIIDRDGIIRLQEFGYFEPEPAEALITRLMGPERA